MSTSPAHNLATLYNAHHGWLHGWLRKRLGCSFEAADLVQDTFMRVLAGRDTAAIREPRAYLTTIAHGLMVNHIQHKEIERRFREAMAVLPESVVPDIETQLILRQTLIEIDAMLQGLSAKARRAFLLSQIEGLTYAEIAVQLDVSVSMVKKYMAQAMRLCMTVALP